jgi:hypothetical protein
MQWVVGSVRKVRITILYILKDVGGRMAGAGQKVKRPEREGEV